MGGAAFGQLKLTRMIRQESNPTHTACFACPYKGELNMAREYEIVSHGLLRYMNIFIVRLVHRTVHIHREIEIGMVLDGSLILTCGGGRHEFKKGDIYYVNQLEPHEFDSENGDAVIMSMQLAPGAFEGLIPDFGSYRMNGCVSLRSGLGSAEDVYLLLSFLFCETACSYLGRGPDFEFSCLRRVSEMFFLMKKHIPSFDRVRDSRETKRQKERILSITDFIDKNFTGKLLLDDIASKEKLSMTYLSHLFKRTLGVSFQEYLKEKRFEYACNLITTTDRTILDISVSSGFSDVRYLTRAFKERYDCTPKQYRAGAKGASRNDRPSNDSLQQFYSEAGSLSLLIPIKESLRERVGGLDITDIL